MGRQEASHGLMPSGETVGVSVDDSRLVPADETAGMSVDDSHLPGARHGASAIGQRDGHENLARPGCIGDRDSHRVEVIERPRVVLVSERYVQRRTRGPPTLAAEGISA